MSVQFPPQMTNDGERRWNVRPTGKQPVSVCGREDKWQKLIYTVTFAVAFAFWQKFKSTIEGLAFVVAPADPPAPEIWLCIDGDHVINPSTGKPYEWFQFLIDFYDTYAEYSRSGKGIHLFLKVRSTPLAGMGQKKYYVDGEQQGAIEAIFNSQIAVTGRPYETLREVRTIDAADLKHIPFFVARPRDEECNADTGEIWADSNSAIPDDLNFLADEMVKWAAANKDKRDDCDSSAIALAAAIRCLRAGCNGEQTLQLLKSGPCSDERQTAERWDESELRRKVNEAFKKVTVDGTIGSQRTPAPEFEQVESSGQEQPAKNKITRRLKSNKLSQVEPRSVDWLWPGWIPVGEITEITGPGGEGKGTTVMDIVARLTSGRPLPDGSPCAKGSVIICAAEDDADTVLRPRADAAGADVECIRAVEGEELQDVKTGKVTEASFTLGDLDGLEELLQTTDLPNVRLIVIDPLGSFIPEKTEMNSEVPMRNILDPLKRLARKHQIAIVIVCHVGKSEHKRAANAALGSVAITNAARSVLTILRNPKDEDELWLVRVKGNFGKPPAGLIYKFVEVTKDVGRVEWSTKRLEMHPNEAYATVNAAKQKKRGPDAEAIDHAEQFLRDFIGDGERQVKEVKEAADAHSITPSTLRRARLRVCLRPFRKETLGPWWLRLNDEGKQLMFLDTADDQPAPSEETNNDQF